MDAALAFSTGRAARYCYVTADTILNWINQGRLQAQRTAGGQHRIRATDLVEFMRENGMSTDLLAVEQGVRPHCWEFNCRGKTEEACRECIAYRSGALHCFALRQATPLDRRLVLGCAECEYHRLYGTRQDQNPEE